MVFGQYILIILSLIAGIVGIAADTRTKEKKITIWGKVLIAVLVLSALFAGWIEYERVQREVLENIKRKETMEGIIEQNSKTLNDVTRLLNPIEEFSISYEMSFSLQEPFAKDYKTRIDSVKDSLNRSAYRLSPNTYPEFTRGTKDTKDGRWIFGNISKESIYYPNTTTESIVRKQINPKLRFGFFKDSTDFQEFLKEDLPKYFLEGKTPISKFDLLVTADRISETTTNELALKDETETILYAKKSGIGVRTLPNNYIKSHNWVGNGKITSIADLKGSYMIILNRTPVPKRTKAFDFDQRQLEFRFPILKIRVASGLVLNVTTEFFKTHRFPHSGYVIQYYQFPEKEIYWNYIWMNQFN